MRPLRRIEARVESNKTKTKNRTSYSIITLSLLFIIFSLFYLFQVTGGTVIGFEKQKLETALMELQKENDKLEVQVAELNTSNQTRGVGMVQVDTIEYLTAADNNVAMLDK